MGNSAMNIDSLLLQRSKFAKQKNMKYTDQHFSIEARFPPRCRDISQNYLTVGTFFWSFSQSYLSLISTISFISHFKGYSKGKSTLKKTPVLTKSLTVDIWVTGTLNWLFIRGICHTVTKVSSFLKKFFVFTKNLLQSWSVENVENFHHEDKAFFCV